jgi:hypothetical protein
VGGSMKRNADLIRKILLTVEAQGDGIRYIEINDEYFVQFSAEEITYHVKLAYEAGYIGEWLESDDGCSVLELSNKGHDFLDMFRDEETWNKVKKLGSKAGGWSLEILADLGKGFLKTQAKRLTGVDI